MSMKKVIQTTKSIEVVNTGLELSKKYCFVKKIDNNILCCAQSASTTAVISVSGFMI